MLQLLQSYWEKLPPDLNRQKAWDRFLSIGLPTRKTEAFQYLSLQRLAFPPAALRKEWKNLDIEPYILPECKEGLLVFVDGFFEENLSRLPNPLVALPFEAAIRSYGLFLQNRLSRSLKEEIDPFAALNRSFQERAAFLYAPPESQIHFPIQILHLFTAAEMSAPRLHLYLGKKSNIHLIQTAAHIGKDPSFLVNGTIDCALDEGAKLLFEEMQEIPQEAQHFQNFYASLKRESLLNMLSFTKGSKLTRFAIKVQLCEEGAAAELRGLWSLKQNLEAHIHAAVEHLAPHTRSRQHFKGILTDQSRSSFEGKILVRPAAQKTEAYQLNNNLLLSEGAAAHVKPNLEIFADDVKASHGATMGQLDEEDLFYLSSRGLPRQMAREWLINGFCREIVDQFSLNSLKQSIQGKLSNAQ